MEDQEDYILICKLPDIYVICMYTNIFTLLQTENEFDASNTKKNKEKEEERHRQEDQRTRRNTSLYVNSGIFEYIYTNICLQTENEFDASNTKKDQEEEEERDGAGDQEDYMDPYGEDEGV